MSKPPIEEQDFICGVNVVQIEDLRIARGLTRRPKSACKHLSLIYDQKERRVWCQDCEEDIEAFDALLAIAERIDTQNKHIERRFKEVREAENIALRSRASKVMDKEWRRFNTIPCCPNCHKGIFPEQVVKGVSCVGKDYAKRLLQKGGANG